MSAEDRYEELRHESEARIRAWTPEEISTLREAGAFASAGLAHDPRPCIHGYPEPDCPDCDIPSHLPAVLEDRGPEPPTAAALELGPGERIVNGRRLYSAAWLAVAALLFAPAASASSPPPPLHIGPPAGPGVKCSRTELRDLTRTPPRVTRLELCYRSRIVRPE